MAGQVRQPIDIAALHRYLTAYVPEIVIPVEVKQVGLHARRCHVPR